MNAEVPCQKDRQQRLWVIRLGPAEHQVELGNSFLGWEPMHSADRGLAMIPQQFDGLVEEFDFVFLTGRSVAPPQPR